jgi:hypothetical protein
MHWSGRKVFWRIKINYIYIRSYLCFITFILKLLGLTLYWLHMGKNTVDCTASCTLSDIEIKWQVLFNFPYWEWVEPYFHNFYLLQERINLVSFCKK